MPVSRGAIAASPTSSTSSFAIEGPKADVKKMRATVVAKKQSTAGMVADGDQGCSGASGNKISVHGANLCSTLKEEAVRHRAQEVVSRPREDLDFPIRRKKPYKKSEEASLRGTVSGSVTSYCVLLTLLVWLGCGAWRLYSGQLLERIRTATPAMPFTTADLEGRISEIEASLRRTEEMLQREMENLGRKLSDEADGVRKNLAEQIDGKGAFYETDLEKLEKKHRSFENSLADLWGAVLLARDEARERLIEAGKSRIYAEKVEGWSLDEIRSHAREVAMKELEKHAADGLGRADYALAAAGARVVRHSEPYEPATASWFPFGKGQMNAHPRAQRMLSPSFGEPGQCLALRGDAGFVEIKLRAAIVLQSVSLEHVAKSVAYDRSSAPRHCRISAWLEAASPTWVERMPPAVEFTYDLDRSNAQTFAVEAAGAGVVDVVRLDFSSNHGSSSHTCIYRLRVHGYDPRSLLPAALQDWSS